MARSKIVASKTPIWKYLRILILLIILLIVAINTWRDKNQDWDKPLIVVIYPINADNSPATEKYIHTLKVQDFKQIADFLNAQSQQYHKNALFYFRLANEVKVLPPEIPKNGGVFSVMLWSLKFRYYAWRYQQDINENISLYVKYYDPKHYSILEHSTALQKGRVGLVNVFASDEQHEQNQIVMAHEILHVFGATDKYDFADHQPIYPQGYADPDKVPRFPQYRAEIMAGTIATSETESKMAPSLARVVVNPYTAQEIGWKKAQE